MPDEEDEAQNEPPPTFAKIFREQFPYYLHLGMTYDEYWHRDCELVRAYRKAYEYKQEYDNSQLWLQGLYVYQAIDALRPGFVFYGKKPPKPEKYLDKPLAITEEMRNRYAAEKTQQMAAKVKAAVHRVNERKEAEGDSDATGSS